MKKNFLAGFFTLLSMFFLFNTANATVLTFEDTAYQGTYWGDLGATYGGFTWSSNFDIYYGPNFSKKWAYNVGTVSGDYALFNSYGVDVSLSGEKFNWEGAWFNDPHNNTLLSITGYLDGAVLYTTSLQLGFGNPVWLDANWTGIDTILFDVNGSDWFTMDNFTFNEFNDLVAEKNAEPVPEPATLFLFGTGLVGLAGSMKRKKK